MGSAAVWWASVIAERCCWTAITPAGGLVPRPRAAVGMCTKLRLKVWLEWEEKIWYGVFPDDIIVPTLDGEQRMRMGEEDKTEAENLRVRDGYFLP